MISGYRVCTYKKGLTLFGFVATVSINATHKPEQDMTKQQELQVRRRAAARLSGIPSRQNANQIELLEAQIAYEELVERFGADEIARCNEMANQD
jgi:hypothetical protein